MLKQHTVASILLTIVMINTVIITLTNRQPAASLTHMDASMEIDRWLQCTSHLIRVFLNLSESKS